MFDNVINAVKGCVPTLITFALLGAGYSIVSQVIGMVGGGGFEAMGFLMGIVNMAVTAALAAFTTTMVLASMD